MTPVIRVSRGNFERSRFAQVERMTADTGEFLIPAISKLDGLLGYYAAVSPTGRWCTSASGSAMTTPTR